MFEDANVHHTTAHESPERLHPYSSGYDVNVEADRFLSQTDFSQYFPEQLASQPAFGQSNSAIRQPTSSQPAMARPKRSSFDTMIERMVAMLAKEGIFATNAEVRDMVLKLQ